MADGQQPVIAYPPIARAAHLSGDVLISFQITPQGEPIGLTVISGPPILSKVSLAFVAEWRFENRDPAREPCETNANFHFALTFPDRGTDVSVNSVEFHTFTPPFRIDITLSSPAPVISDPAETINGRRMPGPPLDSPPFPSGDWSYGGSPTIGVPDGNSYPLMKALGHTTGGMKFYGWINAGVNGSTSTTTNLPEAYDIYPNRIELDQLVAIAERLPDAVQTQHFDWGFRLTAFYGIDYRFTFAKGYFTNQLLVYNRQYGFDTPAEYLDLYFPHVAQGMNLRIGRFLSIPGIESETSPPNYMYSHSILSLVDPFTQTGALATIRINPRWLVQGGVTAGNDVAPWVSDHKLSATVCGNYTTTSNNDNFYVCANGINDGVYAYDNVQQYDATWYHRLTKKTHLATEAWYMYQRQVPNVAGNVANPITPESGTDGAFCGAGQLRCTAPEYAMENYVNHEFSAKTSMSVRTEFLNDKKGQRTGYATSYLEDTVSLTRWFGNSLTLRPELRFEHAWSLPAYDAGRHSSQFTAAADLIYHF